MELFDIGHSNVRCQNDAILNIKLFDILHFNDECQKNLNVKQFDV